MFNRFEEMSWPDETTRDALAFGSILELMADVAPLATYNPKKARSNSTSKTQVPKTFQPRLLQ